MLYTVVIHARIQFTIIIILPPCGRISQGMEDVYIHNLKDGSSVTLHMHKESEKKQDQEKNKRGTNSSKGFTTTMDSRFNRLKWENKGVKINGEFLNNIRFVDDIFICTGTPQ